jgi:arylsulfatase A-like enzyme
MSTVQPNILIIMTDQLRHSPVYESDELRRFRREVLTAETSLRNSGVSFDRHYIMSVACTPSRASILTGH